MSNLQKVSITFNTHNDNKDSDTVLHVFVKNRSVDTFRSNNATDYISNLLSFQAYEASGPFEINPYLAFGQNLLPGSEFGDPSSHTFDIPLRSTPIPIEEVVLPVVNIHILAHGEDTWIFDYTITFFFDDGRKFSSSSNQDGVTGIILDQDNRNYSGLCVENPHITLPPRYPPQSDAVLQQVCLEFYTHGDDANKDDDTVLNVHIVNRLSATANQDIAVGTNLLPAQEFGENSTKRVLFGTGGLPLASAAIRLQDIVLPQVAITMVPSSAGLGRDRWGFNCKVSYAFSNGQTFTSSHDGIILDQDNGKYIGVYQGGPFPNTIPVRGKPPANLADQRSITKSISFSFLQKKLDELVNNRQGLPGQDPPIKRLRLHNTGVFNSSALPESYYDLQSLVANPPAPGVLSPLGSQEDTTYTSSPTSLGQLTGWHHIGDAYLNDIKSQKLCITLDPTQKYPLAVEVDFDCSGPQEVVGGVGGLSFDSFTIRISLSLDYDSEHGRVDILSWVPLVLKSPLILQNALIMEYLQVKVQAGDVELGGMFQEKARGKFFDRLTSPDPYTGKTLRDSLNETANTWLLGGVLANTAVNPCGPASGNDGCLVSAAAMNGDSFDITYTRTGRWYEPTIPADWPTAARPNPAHDFSPGNLANIDHIVVLTMENHSFDSMLGYLSLPPEHGGLGRTDVDGLKGGESNRLRNGQVCPSFAFPPLDTIMTPDLPHSPEPVYRAINGGKMDGFAQAYADERGNTVAPRVMGYYNGVNVPAYDALARDFAIGHRWFASHPGPTFCNRFYELTGRLNIDSEGFWELENSSPLRAVFTPTIFDHLSEQNVSWTYFEFHYCFLRFFQKYTFDTTHISAFDDPLHGFLNLARIGALPSVSFIDPHFVELPPGATCDGPPADVQAGQQFVRQVVEAVVASPKWKKTLLIITYDEHGGFYDHVPPPAATRVSPDGNLPETYGVRVPVFVISPWVQAGTVFGHDGTVMGPQSGVFEVLGKIAPKSVSGNLEGPVASAPVPGPAASVVEPAQVFPTRATPLRQSPPLYFDNTSILKTIARRFLSQNPPYMGARYAEANDLSLVLGDTQHVGQFLPFIPYNLVYGASLKGLAVQSAQTTAGASLQLADAIDTIAQQFSFEDVGDGSFYIRTLTGNLYLTADDSLGVTQQLKYPTDGSAQPVYHPSRQRWQLTQNNITARNNDSFTVRNAFFPGKVLQPAGGSTNAGAPAVLGDPHATIPGVIQTPNPWLVTSPRLPSSGPVMEH